MIPKTREKASTSSGVHSPLRKPLQPKGMISSRAAMKMMPPMVGVPDLALCQVGPTSRMDCPAFRARSTGMSSLPTSTDSAKAQTAASRMRSISRFSMAGPPDHSSRNSFSTVSIFMPRLPLNRRVSPGLAVLRSMAAISSWVSNRAVHLWLMPPVTAPMTTRSEWGP